jgi:hypothetical protein
MSWYYKITHHYRLRTNDQSKLTVTPAGVKTYQLAAHHHQVTSQFQQLSSTPSIVRMSSFHRFHPWPPQNATQRGRGMVKIVSKTGWSCLELMRKSFPTRVGIACETSFHTHSIYRTLQNTGLGWNKLGWDDGKTECGWVGVGCWYEFMAQIIANRPRMWLKGAWNSWEESISKQGKDLKNVRCTCDFVAYCFRLYNIHASSWYNETLPTDPFKIN